MLEKFKALGRRKFPRWMINIYHLLGALLAVLRYGYPARKLKVIGVTGTDGKTTTCYFIYSILREGGKKVGLISSIDTRVRSKIWDTGIHVTSPDPWKLQKMLKKMVDLGCEYTVLETTSSALDQFRVLGCNFKVGVLTNITHEHLNYHGDFEYYLYAKSKLLKNVPFCVLNKDDPSYPYLLRKAKGKVISYGVKEEACVKAVEIREEKGRPVFKYVNKDSALGEQLSFDREIKLGLLGEYNVENALAAIGACFCLGIPEHFMKKGLENVQRMKGRMETVYQKDFEVIIDFAHTPNGLKNALESVRKRCPKRLIVVFGCAGLRDKAKRPAMGEIAQNLADLVVLTAEDPRTEDALEIIEQIARGCKQAGGVEGRTYYKVSDRQEAINFAIRKLAQEGDCVIIAGKGHEKTMCFGEEEVPWSDFEAVRKALRGI